MDMKTKIPKEYKTTNLDKIKMVQFETIEELIAKSYGLTTEEFDEVESFHELEQYKGKLVPRDIPKAEYVGEFKKWGYYGMALPKQKELWFWIGINVKEEDLVEFFSHELGHFVGDPKLNEIIEEYRATSYQKVGLKAFKLMTQYISKLSK